MTNKNIIIHNPDLKDFHSRTLFMLLNTKAEKSQHNNDWYYIDVPLDKFIQYFQMTGDYSNKHKVLEENFILPSIHEVAWFANLYIDYKIINCLFSKKIKSIYFSFRNIP